MICAKLSVHMTGDDAAEKDWRLFDIWDWRFDKLPVISAKLSLRVMGATRLEKQDASPISELASSIFEWPLRILSSPLRSLKSRRVLIFL